MFHLGRFHYIFFKLFLSVIVFFGKTKKEAKIGKSLKIYLKMFELLLLITDWECVCFLHFQCSNWQTKICRKMTKIFFCNIILNVYNILQFNQKFKKTLDKKCFKWSLCLKKIESRKLKAPQVKYRGEF